MFSLLLLVGACSAWTLQPRESRFVEASVPNHPSHLLTSGNTLVVPTQSSNSTVRICNNNRIHGPRFLQSTDSRCVALTPSCRCVQWQPEVLDARGVDIVGTSDNCIDARFYRGRTHIALRWYSVDTPLKLLPSGPIVYRKQTFSGKADKISKLCLAHAPFSHVVVDSSLTVAVTRKPSITRQMETTITLLCVVYGMTLFFAVFPPS